MTYIIGVIPARGGSKGIKNKNIVEICGHPLIAYSIKHAINSKIINRVIVSTNSHVIKQKALSYGAEVPFMRPNELAKDDSTDLDVFKHLIYWLEKNNQKIPELFVHLRPTSPVRDVKDIEVGVKKLLSSDADSLRSVIISPLTPFKMWRLTKNEFLEPLLINTNLKEPFNMPRQLLPEVYWQTANLDIIKTDTIIKKNSISGLKILPLLIKKDYAIDIDVKYDLEIARRFIIKSDYTRKLFG